MKKSFLYILLFVLIGMEGCNNSAGSSAANGGTAAASGGVVGSGSDLYYQYDISGGGKNMAMNGSMKLYLAASGKVRMEMKMGLDTNSQAVKGGMGIVMLGNSTQPNESIDLDDAKKTYTHNHVDTADLNAGGGMKSKSTVTKIGEETVLGFSCIHARIISDRSLGSFYKDVDTMDVWKSKDVPVQAAFQYWMDRYNARSGGSMYSADAGEKLKAMGCEGFMVKMQTRSKSSGMTMALTKVEKKDFSGSLFEIPAGYTEDKNGGM